MLRELRAQIACRTGNEHALRVRHGRETPFPPFWIDSAECASIIELGSVCGAACKKGSSKSMVWLYLGSGLIGLLTLWFVVRTIRLLIRYRLSPAWKWREDVFRLGGAVRQGMEAERQALGQAGLQAAAQDQALRQEAFNGFIAGISVDQLDAYPGSGPSTTAKLR